MFLCSCVQEENQILQQVATWIHEEQVDLARGLTTGRFVMNKICDPVSEYRTSRDLG